MTEAVFEPTFQPQPIPVRELLPWAVFVGLLLLLALYFVGRRGRRDLADSRDVRA